MKRKELKNMSFNENIKEKAKQNIKTIVLPESEDIRVLQAAAKILQEDFANIILIGNEQEVQNRAKQNQIDITKAQIIDPKTSSQYEEYVSTFYELRKHKGMTIEKAKETILEPIYFGTMMLKRWRSRWVSIWCLSFYCQYPKTSASNFENSSRY